MRRRRGPPPPAVDGRCGWHAVSSPCGSLHHLVLLLPPPPQQEKGDGCAAACRSSWIEAPPILARASVGWLEKASCVCCCRCWGVGQAAVGIKRRANVCSLQWIKTAPTLLTPGRDAHGLFFFRPPNVLFRRFGRAARVQARPKQNPAFPHPCAKAARLACMQELLESAPQRAQSNKQELGPP